MWENPCGDAGFSIVICARTGVEEFHDTKPGLTTDVDGSRALPGLEIEDLHRRAAGSDT
jgi:hypothetical protein